MVIINQKIKIMEKTLQKETSAISIENLQASQLPEFQGWKEKQLQIVKENPFVAIDDNKTYEEAKKARTTLVSARTDIEKQDKLVASKLRELRSKVSETSKELISITLPYEERQQSEVREYEAKKEQERKEKERIEQERKDAIKKEIDEFYAQWKNNIANVTFAHIEALETEMKSEIDTNIEMDWEEFELDLIEKTRLLESQLAERKTYLNQKEEQRKESERLAKEREALEADRKRAEAEQAEKDKKAREAAKAEADKLAKEREEMRLEREAIEKEKEAHRQKLAKEQKEKEDAERKAKEDAERIEAEKRAKALKPEKEKLQDYLMQIKAPKDVPEVKDASIITLMGKAITEVEELRESLLKELSELK